jgi:hypothetical protein
LQVKPILSIFHMWKVKAKDNFCTFKVIINWCKMRQKSRV